MVKMARMVFWFTAVMAILSLAGAKTNAVAKSRSSSTKGTRASKRVSKALCNKVDGCPTIASLELDNAELKLALELQAEINSLLIAQNNFMQYEIQALSNATSKPYVPPSSVLPYNEAACRAIPYTNYIANDTRGWVFFGTTSAQPFKPTTCAVQYTTAPTCAQICAARGRKCDPCAMSKLGCQDAVYFAAQNSNLDTSNFKVLTNGESTMFDYPPGPPGPWPQSTCANQTYNGTANGLGGWSDLLGNTQIEVVCDSNADSKNDLFASFWSRPHNYYDRSDNSTYRDPATLCDLPVAYADPNNEPGKLGVVYYSTACYCSK